MVENKFSPEESKFLLRAKNYLEDPSIFIKIVNLVGEPIEYGMKKLPNKAQKVVNDATSKSLKKALSVSLLTISKKPCLSCSDFESARVRSSKSHWGHTAGATVTGAAGGFFGLIALPIELPVTTGIMLRAIAESARSWGFDPSAPEFSPECLYVFTLGSKSEHTDAMESSYYTSRVAFSALIKEATNFISQNSTRFVIESAEKGSAPVIIKLITTVAQRFEVAVSEKLIAEAIPLVGAIGGASINAAFSDHFARSAHFHFGIKYLEKKYGKDSVEKEYIEILAKQEREP